MSYALVTCHKCSSPGRRHVRSGTDDEHDVHDAMRHGVRHCVRYEHIRHICVSSSIYVHFGTRYIVSSLSVTLASRWAPSRTHGSHDNLSRNPPSPASLSLYSTRRRGAEAVRAGARAPRTSRVLASQGLFSRLHSQLACLDCANLRLSQSLLFSLSFVRAGAALSRVLFSRVSHACETLVCAGGLRAPHYRAANTYPS